MDVGAVTMQCDERRPVPGVLVIFAPKAPSGLSFSFRETKTGVLYVKDYDDNELAKAKDSAGISHGWAPFFKSIAADVSKGKAVITSIQGAIVLAVSITSTKDATSNQAFTVTMKPKPNPPSQADLIAYMIAPMSRMVQARRLSTADMDKELRFVKIECEQTVKEASQRKNQQIIDRLKPMMNSLREESERLGKSSGTLAQQVHRAERRLRKLQRPKDRKHALDVLYEDGGARPFQHIPQAEEHEPVEKSYSADLCEVIRKNFNGKFDQGMVDAIASISRTAPSSPEMKAIKAFNESIDLNCFSRIDFWDYNVFKVEEMTNGNSLFYTTYAILHKLNLPATFNIDDKVLRNFLIAVQAGYHPNPYHNAIHAADVAQINYFIMMRCGLSTVCSLSQEEVLAGVLAGAIHDFDHPGLNNSFHYQTSAYLSTLYNDRSILENHHLACVFEMLRGKKYNIFSKLTDEQARVVRDTMTEMVLSTDMGMHGKILSAFQRRIQEGAKWAEKKEDALLALSMSIKMADIANCGRPTDLYIGWAKNIAAEFYNQGDVERKLKLSISPFMDRRKDKVDFPKGQTSFINFVVLPTFEAMAELLPSLNFTFNHCAENKEYWLKKEMQNQQQQHA